MKMKGKVIGLVVSIIIIIGVAIGLVFCVRHAYNSNHQHKDPLASTSKAVHAICSPTDYKEVCVHSLGSVSKNNQSATLYDYIQAAIKSNVDAIRQSIDKSQLIGKNAKDPLNKMSFDDCEELLELSINELHIVLNHTNDSNFSTLKEMEHEIKNWLSATISYQQSCIDGIEKLNLKEEMSKGLDLASKLSSNMLAIMSEIDTILSSFGIETNVTINSKQNLQKDGYPLWVTKYRKLLGRINTNNPMPNVIVAQDGSGQYKTISDAIKAYPKNLKGRYVIYVKAGIYNEQVLINKDQINIFMYGDGPRKTIVTGRKSNRDGVSTYQSASFG